MTVDCVFSGVLKEKYGIIGFFQVNGLKLSRKFSSEESIAAVKEFDSFKPDDVIIGTYPKTGRYLYTVLYIAVSLDIYFIFIKYKHSRNSLNSHKFKSLAFQVLVKSLSSYTNKVSL